MTVVTKPTAVIRKPVIIKPIRAKKNACREAKLEIHGVEILQGKKQRALVCITLIAILLGILLFISGLIICHQSLITKSLYLSRCSIVVPNDVREPENDNMHQPDLRVLPLQWLQNVQFVSTQDENSSDKLMNFLHEELNIDGSFEKITVMDNGRQIDFIHDFDNNHTTIIDKDRCFMMQLEQEAVLPPDVFLAALRRGAVFDVSRVRRRVRAAPAPAPPATARPAAPARCAALPAYWLYADDGVDVHKREAEAESAASSVTYVHFSGNRVQEIHVANLPELLRHEAARR